MFVYVFVYDDDVIIDQLSFENIDDLFVFFEFHRFYIIIIMIMMMLFFLQKQSLYLLLFIIIHWILSIWMIFISRPSESLLWQKFSIKNIDKYFQYDELIYDTSSSVIIDNNNIDDDVDNYRRKKFCDKNNNNPTFGN